MKISYNWLKQFLQIDWDAQKTGELLTDLGLEVEGITQFESVKGGLKGILVGHVLTCEPHPNADRLKLTTVDIGQEAPVQIVCGAPNVAAGQKVPVATVGTTLYTKEGEAWVIKKGKIRGEVSQGMICAEDEIGLGESHDGIMVLNEELVPGTPCAKVFDIENDEVFEIGLTPNRADAMSHFGVARDLKAGLEQKEIQKELVTPSVSNFSIDNRSLKVDVEVMESDLAPRYCGVTINNLVVQDSPDWLKNRLKAIGLAPINNVVDVTNYVLHELGQPLHAFDASKIKGSKVEVKTLPSGTKFTTLDEVERELHEDDLMICDAEKPMCIAGVFGGLHSGVTEHTTSIFLESAYFDPVSIRKTAKRHGLNTDASFRFERGIDINLTKYALKRAALLIREIAGGYITSEIVDLFPKKPQERQVFLTFNKINSLIGQEIPRDTIKSILSSLEIRINNVTESGLGLTIPTYRVDVTREVDVIEEILRVYGYNNIDFKEKLNASIAKTSRFENYRIQDVVGNLLASKGFYEIMTNSLVANTMSSEEDGAVQMLNPLSSDLSVLRTSMLHSGLQTVSYNHNRQKTDLKLFEFGKTYHKVDGAYQENQHLALFVSGDRTQSSWAVAPKKSEFFYLKGIVENVFERLGVRDLDTQPLGNADYSEGISYTKNDMVLVSLGLVSRAVLKQFDIKQEVFYADLNWDALLKLVSTQNVVFKEIPKFPEVTRDFALLLDESVSFQKVYDIAWKTERKLLKKVNLFDVYTGNNLPEGKKSYAVSFTLMDEKKTLTDKQIDKIMGKLLAQYQKELGAELR
ncbi:MAG: phenylalanine--tRNA ligase subunit beta [Muricauda sp.]|jgi:phenylalanyl-tRNA synthetase beta chain|nr:phenylalanine--tRNA ligase subunit beta [Allomuricauda sp.]MBO6589135.1 phenylalanine--tRNA ligase subunit beta [Allomuricauda sp.]MBO6618760.1 phenylalanine--tRNA ligase subunit beta [Allomuricauda sp.]MBO6644673.1 phenylalanine--tRNA ligase subunit beta [Allomuricauda sp.]MBO6746573.1 phenylalanine--tRNA ligase subunit beta [Allomuricauda sp.]MBO6843343.1 phenylalanine--tRNA ligase subunit beta [Allomuricauda sp.]